MTCPNPLRWVSWHSAWLAWLVCVAVAAEACSTTRRKLRLGLFSFIGSSPACRFGRQAPISRSGGLWVALADETDGRLAGRAALFPARAARRQRRTCFRRGSWRRFQPALGPGQGALRAFAVPAFFAWQTSRCSVSGENHPRVEDHRRCDGSDEEEGHGSWIVLMESGRDVLTRLALLPFDHDQPSRHGLQAPLFQSGTGARPQNTVSSCLRLMIYRS